MITQSSTRQAGQRATGVVAQFVLLVFLWAGVGLGPVGWLAGMGCAVAVWVMLTAALRRSPGARLGPADWVTQSRAVLVGGVTALLADQVGGDVPTGLLVVLASVALALDAVDGQLARRTGTASALGARFDMEVDAFLILVLSAHLATPFGDWVLAIGAMRYIFVAVGAAAPWLRAALPPSLTRKTVAAAQGITLVVASSGIPPRPLSISALLVALALLSWSFGRDTLWLWRNSRRPASVAAFAG